MLYANSPVPLYKQLYRQLRQSIEEGDMAVGDQLPSERQMSAEHGISRLTTRKALELLQEEGYVEAYQGIGSFVSQSELTQQRRVTFDSLDERAIKLGLTPRIRIVSCGVITADSELAERMDLRNYARIIKIRRLLIIDDIPVALHTAYLPYLLCAPILNVDLEQRSLYRALEDDLDIQLAYADQTLRLVLGQANDLTLLGLEPPVVMMQHTQRTFDDRGRLVLYLEDLYRNNDLDLHPRL